MPAGKKSLSCLGEGKAGQGQAAKLAEARSGRASLAATAGELLAKARQPGGTPVCYEKFRS